MGREGEEGGGGAGVVGEVRGLASMVLAAPWSLLLPSLSLSRVGVVDGALSTDIHTVITRTVVSARDRRK